jgi:hypothetical protein
LIASVASHYSCGRVLGLDPMCIDTQSRAARQSKSHETIVLCVQLQNIPDIGKVPTLILSLIYVHSYRSDNDTHSRRPALATNDSHSVQFPVKATCGKFLDDPVVIKGQQKY